MSNSGYRGRNFGPRGARTNGPANGYSGLRFPHPNFNHPRPPHRLSGPDKWIERPNFAPWQQNNNFLAHSQHRGNLQFRPNGRGRAAGGRGIVRFSGPGRPPASQFYMGYKRNPIPRALLPQEELIDDKTVLVPQTPLLGSEEERQQKITETADKLKQKLSSITEEELTNFWEDDLSILSNNGSEENNTCHKGIPELRHEPPELDLTFTDFRDIGRVDCNSSKFDGVDNKSTDEISVTFEQKSTDGDPSTHDEIIIVEESKEQYSTTLDLTHDEDNLDQTNILSEDDKCPEQIHPKLSDFEGNTENLEVQDDNAAEGLILANSDNGKISSTNLNENITDLAPIESTDELIAEGTSGVSDIEQTSVSLSVKDDQDTLQTDISQIQSSEQVDIKEEKENIIKPTSEDVHHDQLVDAKKLECSQVQNDLQANASEEVAHQNSANASEEVAHQNSANASEEVAHQNSANASESPRNRQFNLTHSNEDIQSGIFSDSTSASYSTYNEVHKLNDDKKLSKPCIFQPRSFGTPPRFSPRIAGPRCNWTFPQNVENVFFGESQRLPFHGNRISPSRHVVPFPVGFDPRAPPPFTSSDLLPAFDPSEPPPNIRPVAEPSNRQENMKTMPPLDARNQAANLSQSNIAVVQSPPVFDPRGPPPRIPSTAVTTNEKLLEFNPQQPPPKIHKRDEPIQLPPIFDPRLSSQERSSLIVPLKSSRSNMMPMNVMETPQITDYSIGTVAPNFSQLPPVNMPPHQTFLSSVPMNFPSALPQTSNSPAIMREFAILPPPLNISEIPPPPPIKPLTEENSNVNRNISMDDGLEDMQEAMEFAKQIMNMTEETKSENVSSVFPKVPLIPSSIPVPIEGTPSLLVEERYVNTTKKQRKRESKLKKCKPNVVCGPELIVEKQEDSRTVEEEQSIQNQSKHSEDALFSNDQIRPKVVFNLNSKAKRIHKPEEWHRTSINIPENKDSHQSVSHSSTKTKMQSKKYSSDSRRSSGNQNKHNEKESSFKVNSSHGSSFKNVLIQEKSNDNIRNSEKLHLQFSNKIMPNNTNAQKSQKARRDSKKVEAPSLETSWKNRVINRFLKMSKNDIYNMVNNSSLRKFDIAMKHLVKEKRSSLSLEMRNTEDEKMKEYDREEFMNQLNAMLDPSAVVAITDLPTEFIHHLSEVLQLERMPFEGELPENQTANLDEANLTNQNETSSMHISEHPDEKNAEAQPFIEYSEPENICREHRETEEKFVYNKEEPIHLSQTLELNLNISREDTSSSHRSFSNKINPEPENKYKKQQQPLFNEADLDDILSEVTEKTRNLPSSISSVEPEKPIETQPSSSLTQAVTTEAFKYNTFSEIPNKTAADLDDIFSAGIARVKLLGKSNVNSDNTRTRKSSSEDRNTFRPERYERWNRKEREDLDTFRNLTKEEWEAKYGATNATTAPTIVRKSASNSAENLSRDSSYFHAERYGSSNSSMRHLSLSPLTREDSTYNVERCHPGETEELRRTERSESSSDSTSSSSSDSDEETVSHNVTKLLKVIKENEKIAKKKSLNETIRDEVAAEIEKKWKEKSKYKERKSRKYERRKKDKRDKRRKEKRKKKKRNSYSGSSISGDHVEGFRLFTEDEIKKEVIVKEEPLCSFEENVPVDSGTDNSYIVPSSINKIIDTQNQYQSLQVVREQIPTILSDITMLQSRNKLPAVSMAMQPKTKAQLKQMPELNNEKLKQSMEEQTAEVPRNDSIPNTDNAEITDFLEANKNKEKTESINERMDAVSSTSIPLQQTNVPLNTGEPSSFVRSPIENTNDSATYTKSLTCSSSNPVADVNTSNQSAARKISTSTTSSTENKSCGYKKIDIKAYKERALQRRLKEQAMLTGNSGCVASVAQDSRSLSPSKPNIESISAENKIKKTEIDASIAQPKDPHLTKIKSTGAHSLEDSNKQDTKKSEGKPLEREDHPVDAVQKNKKSSASVQLKNTICEQNTARLKDLNTLKNPTKRKEQDNRGKSLPHEAIATRKVVEASSKEKSRLALKEKISKKSAAATESCKFKNIRSEGGKELKLKKEKAKKAAEKKKKDLKLNESKSLVAVKHVEKHSHREVSEGNQESLPEKINITAQTETTSSVDSKILPEHSDIHPIVEQDTQECIIGEGGATDSKEGIQQVVEEILENQQNVDQEIIMNEDSQRSVNTKNEMDIVSRIGETATQVIKESTLAKNLSKQEDVCKVTIPLCPTSYDHSESVSTEPCVESTVSLLSDSVSEKSPSFTEHIDVGVGKSVHSANIECLKDIAERKNSPDIEMDSEVIGKGDNMNLVTNNPEERTTVNSTSQLHESVKNSGNCDKVLENETKSPDSPCSPFKGFVADSVEDDTYQVSQSYALKVNSESDKENLNNYSKQWLEPSFTNKLILESAKGNKYSDKRSKKRKEGNEATSMSNLMEMKKDLTKIVDNSLTVTDSIDIGTTLEAENTRITEAYNQGSDSPLGQEKPSPAVYMDSHNIFEEDSEPFIVLDEYIDDPDEKSIEKLSALDLDLEECIARDADIFTNKSMEDESLSGNINSMDFKELAQVFDDNSTNSKQCQSDALQIDEKLKIVESERIMALGTESFASEEKIMNATDVVSSTSGSNIEPTLKLSEIMKLTDSSVSEVPIESSQHIISTTSKDSSQSSVTPELSSTEARTIAEENLHCMNTSEYNVKQADEPPNTSRTIVKFCENEISSKLPDSIRSGTDTSLISVPNTEPLELHSQAIIGQRKAEELSFLSDQKISDFSGTGMSSDKDEFFDSILDQEISRNTTQTILTKSNQREKEDALHKLKNISKMKRKKPKRDMSQKILKEVVNSDTVKIKYPSTKEAILARMIDIDVEIHKLMTEKMTLYQMLTNDGLQADNDLGQNNVMQEEKEFENIVTRPRTPSVLMSHLLQNIETSPITNQCSKTIMEKASPKDIVVDTIQPSKTKTLSKHDYHTEKEGSCTSNYGSDDEEVKHYSEGGKSSRKRKKPKASDRVVKKLQNKLTISVSPKHTQNTITEKKQIIDITKLTSRKINKKQITIQQNSSPVTITGNQSQKDVNKTSIGETPKDNALNDDNVGALEYQEVERISEPKESQMFSEEINPVKDTQLHDENSVLKNNEENAETLNEKIADANSSTELPESRTPERSSIYSDDSTWDSLLQASSVDDQKKSNIGLALLEETYRKEMAKTRKVKAEARKKRRNKLQNLSQSIEALTPEEEELPLSALYVKKIHQKKKVLNSLDQQTKQQEIDDPQLWKNVEEVINAVAENRTGDLYVQQVGQESSDVNEETTRDMYNPEENSEFKENKEEEMMYYSTLKDSNSTELCGDVQISDENEDAGTNNLMKDSLDLSLSKSQEFAINQHFQQDLEISVSLKDTKDIAVAYMGDTSTNIEKDSVEFPIQQAVENDNVEINQQASIEDPNSCLTVLNSNNTHNSNTLGNLHTENVEKEKVSIEDKVPNVQNTDCTIEDISMQESTNSPSVVTTDSMEKSTDDAIKINRDKDISKTISEINSKEDSNSEMHHSDEDKSKDSVDSSKKDDNVNDAVEETSYLPQVDEYMSLKEHKVSHKNKEINHSTAASNEENNNQNFASVSSFAQYSDTLRNEETLGKKSSKRKRGSSKAPLRRSSRYAEESTKRIKIEIDANPQNPEQEQDKSLRIYHSTTASTSSSPCEEIENLSTNPKKNRVTHKSVSSRKRCSPMLSEIESISPEPNASNEAPKGIKRYKQCAMSEMMNCAVQLIDCKHTILNPNVSHQLLQNYGISRINTHTYSNPTQINSLMCSVQLPSTKDLSSICTKQTIPVNEFPQIQISPKVKTVVKPAKVNCSVDDSEECIDPDIEVMPVLMKDPVIVDISQNCEKPDIEIVEEKKIVTKNQQQSNSGLTLTVIDTKDDKELPRTQYTVHKGPILDIKVFENSFLAASEDGRIYRYNQASNGILNIYKGHEAAVTCLYVHNASSTDISREWMFSGSLDGTLRCYNITTGIQIRDTADIGSPIQCMDESWGIIFIGTKSGHVSRYHIKSGVIKGNSIQFSDKSVLALKATNEGPRRVLIVASRSQPITIRDAQSGLFLRTICGQKSHTVYSLMRDHNLIYCGTSSTSIPVFDFTNGEETMQYDAGVGIVCMRLYKQLLFAGCYDGNIYVFDTKDHRLVCSIPGPGNMLLSMEVIDNKIIAGSKDKRLQSWKMPLQARSLL